MQRRSWWPAVGIVGVIVSMGLTLSVLGIVGDRQTPPPAAAAPAAATDTTQQPSVCGLPDEELSGTVAEAPATQWSLVGTIAAPAVEGQGPGRIEDDGFRSCFAHTPTGAVVAAANLAAMGSYAPLRPRFNREAIAPGPGRDAVLAKPLPQGGTDGVRLQLAGFRLLRYTGAQADLDLALLASTGQLFGATLFLEWAEGDWKARMGDDGSDLSSISPISSLAGYVAWSAENG